jgi:ribosomal protein S18 acetylase RimI-like enzyme
VSLTDHSPIRRAREADRAAVADVLGAAFLDDPVFAWLIPDRDERAPLLAPMFDALAEAFARHDATWVTTGAPTGDGEVTGAALWAPPGVPAVDPADEDRLNGRLGELAGPHAERLALCLEVFGAAHPSEPAWFLQFLGTGPAHQGRGVGSSLLRTVLASADRAGEAAYLEATSDRNRRLYERHGFRHVADLPLPDGPTAYAMWRDPRPT